MIPRKPPIAEPKTTPTRDGSKPFSAASSFASTAAASARRTFRSSRRASFVLDEPGRIEVLDLGRDPDREAARVERLDEVDPALAGDRGAPGRRRVVAERRDCAETRDGDSPHAASLVLACRARTSHFRRWRPSSSRSSRTGDWQYEPKWDGFRGVLENDGGELALWSRNERPLLRYFPELEPLGKLLPPHSALDGEIVISKKGQLDFDSMQLRLHPAESRIRKLSAEIPAQFIAFDILLWKGEKLHELPLEKRRKELERKAKRFQLSPYSRDLADAERWLDRLEAAGLDGVVAKRLGAPYLPGSREGVVKVKKYKTADCVIVGYRYSEKAEGRISTLLLGLYDKDGELDFVGHCSGMNAAVRRQVEEELPKLRKKGFISDKRIPGGQSRWSQGRELDWHPVKPKLVVEVRYDKIERNRFRHGTRLIRFRPDKDPKDCTWREVRPPRRRGDPTVDSLLGAA